ncbi:MAG: caspase family protein [Planctomycetota bacterium]|jgi:hypothetical protein
MAKRAVCIGINDYPGTFNDLGGCVNDANDWADLLKDEFGFGKDVQMITDSAATKDKIVKALEDLVTGSEDGDIAVFTYSGHGTWVPDQGDYDECDNRDEAICAYDGNILDDEIREIIRKMKSGVRLTVISDSCHSGGVTKAMLARARNIDAESATTAPRPRYMPPDNDTGALRTLLVPVRKRFLYPEADMQEILISGCNATEYSYDAVIGGRPNGAMTALATRIIKSNPSGTYKEFHEKLRELLPSTRYPQSPQLEGSDANKNRPLFS